MTKLTTSGPDVFWGEIAPCEHLVQIYDEASPFLDALTGFVAGGLRMGDAVIVIATPPHLLALEDRLDSLTVDVDHARRTDQYIALDAEQTLTRFMVQGWPDEQKFATLVRALLTRARGDGRKVRAFGEMVALLWARGHSGATVQLEHMWHQLCKEEVFSLFCAYPKSGFTENSEQSIRDICAAHSRVVKPRCASV